MMLPVLRQSLQPLTCLCVLVAVSIYNVMLLLHLQHLLQPLAQL